MAGTPDRDLGLDALARAVADGDLSRREVVGKAAALFLGVSLANPLEAFAKRVRCRKGHRRCGSKCCPPGFVCQTPHGHRPRCVCPPHKVNCGGRCVDLHSDPAHCGRCGTHCPPGNVCVDGKCQLHCAPGQANCAGACVSLGSDPANCGACGTTCGPGQVCSSGQCTTTCDAGLTLCGASCIALASDPANCGACGNACAAGAHCADGTCVSDAAPATCSDGVKNGQETDVDCGGPNCPKCADGKKCLSGTDCVSGVCTGGVCVEPAPTCSDGIQNEAETDIDCGGPNCPKCANGKKCTGGADCVTGICAGGVCHAQTCTPGTMLSCGVGQCARMVGCVVGNETCTPGTPSSEVCNGLDDDCDGQTDNGAICPGFSHATFACQGGNCALVACDPGWGDCNADSSDGCETDLSTVANCGSCGNNCAGQAAGHLCINHTCGCSTSSDCNAGSFCNSGTCVAKKPAGQICSSGTECLNGNCVDGYCCNSSSCPGGHCNCPGSLGTCSATC